MAKDSAEKGLSEEAVKLFDLAKVRVHLFYTYFFYKGPILPTCLFVDTNLPISSWFFVFLFFSIQQNHDGALEILNKLLSQVMVWN